MQKDQLVFWLHSNNSKLHYDENLSSLYDDALAYADVANGKNASRPWKSYEPKQLSNSGTFCWSTL